jgi:hypothetical protein
MAWDRVLEITQGIFEARLERELLAAYQGRDVVEAQAIRRELSSLKATLVTRLEDEASGLRRAKAWTRLMDVPARS